MAQNQATASITASSVVGNKTPDVTAKGVPASSSQDVDEITIKMLQAKVLQDFTFRKEIPSASKKLSDRNVKPRPDCSQCKEAGKKVTETTVGALKAAPETEGASSEPKGENASDRTCQVYEQSPATNQEEQSQQHLGKDKTVDKSVSNPQKLGKETGGHESLFDTKGKWQAKGQAFSSPEASISAPPAIRPRLCYEYYASRAKNSSSTQRGRTHVASKLRARSSRCTPKRQRGRESGGGDRHACSEVAMARSVVESLSRDILITCIIYDVKRPALCVGPVIVHVPSSNFRLSCTKFHEEIAPHILAYPSTQKQREPQFQLEIRTRTPKALGVFLDCCLMQNAHELTDIEDCWALLHHAQQYGQQRAFEVAIASLCNVLDRQLAHPASFAEAIHCPPRLIRTWYLFDTLEQSPYKTMLGSCLRRNWHSWVSRRVSPLSGELSFKHLFDQFVSWCKEEGLGHIPLERFTILLAFHSSCTKQDRGAKQK